jgi:lysophospholipase L1-like esterase
VRAATVIALFLIACLLLSACGGGTGTQSTSSPSPSPPPPIPPSEPPSSSWNYTALGDSLAFGILAASGYVPRYQTYIQTDTGVNVVLKNLGENGWKSGDLLNALQSDITFRASLQNSQVITWDIGGNDLLHAHNRFKEGTCGGTDNQDCFRTAVISFESNWDSVVAQILSLRSRDTTIIRTMNVYNPFVAEDQASGNFAKLNPYLDEINQYISNSATRNSIFFADIHKVFNGSEGNEDPAPKGLIAIDRIHPNDKGHKAIADSLRALQYTPLK